MAASSGGGTNAAVDASFAVTYKRMSWLIEAVMTGGMYLYQRNAVARARNCDDPSRRSSNTVLTAFKRHGCAVISTETGENENSDTLV